MSRRSTALGLGGALLLLLVPAALLAQDNQLDTMVNTALFASQDWLSRVLPEAQSLFLMLVGLEITVTVLVWAYMHLSGKLTLGGVLATTFQKVILLVLCSLSLQSFPMFLPKILALFQKAGGDIAGIQGLSPTSLLDQGIYLSSRVLYMSNQAGLFEIPAVITSLVLAFVLLVCFVLLAWRMTSLLIEGAILVSGGALFMGFSASRFTIQLAENYIISIIRLGAHTYLILFCIAVGNRLVPIWGLEINNYLYSVDGFAVLFRIAGEVLIFTLVTLRLPGDLAYKLTAPSGFLHLRGALVASY
ncbi:MAG TPA: type IV secretion system protein [Thermoanaerobaculia bacterium]|jgi:P-type conjugative transfer protein TrbL